MEGLITEETDEYVELSVDFGTVKFYRQEIARIKHSSPEEKRTIEQTWKEKRLKKEQEIEKHQKEKDRWPQEIEISREGNHAFVNVVLNERTNAKLLIDTGASLVILSPKIAQELNINVNSAHPQIKMSLGDGREVPAQFIKIDTVDVGRVRAKDIEAAVIYQDDAFPIFDGLLGMSFLRLFKFEINLEQNKLVLEKL
jgi:clan AA aspartic protease (TIGR02281 family)